MATKKKAADKPAVEADEPEAPAETAEPGDINSSLSSDRMKALLEDHRAMGSRPK